MTKRILAAELVRTSISSPIQEKLGFNDREVSGFLTTLKNDFEEVFIITSYDRFSIYVFGETINPLIDFFSENFIATSSVRYFTNSENSVHHLFATVGGLSSQVRDDYQMVDVVENAYHLALSNGSISVVMDNLLRKAISMGRRIREESGIDHFYSTMVKIGFTLLSSRMSDLYGRTFFIIGTGRIAQLALEWIRREGIYNVVLAGHDIRRASELSAKYNVQLVTVKEIETYFNCADVIISDVLGKISVSLGGFLLSQSGLISRRIILDYGIPNNFDDFLRDAPGVELYDIDDLKQRMPHMMGSDTLEKSWAIVLEETHNFILVLNELDQTPAFHMYWDKAVNWREHELIWLFPKVSTITEREKELIRKNTSRLTNLVLDSLKAKSIIVGGGIHDVAEILKRDYDIKLNLSVN